MEPEAIGHTDSCDAQTAVPIEAWPQLWAERVRRRRLTQRLVLSLLLLIVGALCILIPLSEDPEASRRTAQATGTAVANAVEVWTGVALFETDPLRIELGDASAGRALPYYDIARAVVCVNAFENPDAVAHECGHAALHRLKPGRTTGAAIIIHEAIADMIAVLVPLRSPRNSIRLLRSSGGRLDVENEASRIVDLPSGGCLRSALSNVAVDAFPVGPDTIHLSGVPGAPDDPHLVSGVLTGALYESFRALAEGGGDRATAASTRRAADAVGTVMLAAVHLCNEHRVTLGEYAAALCRTADALLGADSGLLFRAALGRRGLLSAGIPAGLPPSGFRPAATPAALSLDGVELLEVIHNPTVAPGGTFLRFRYAHTPPPPDPFEWAARVSLGADPESEVLDAYAALLFDFDGALVFAARDTPVRSSTAIQCDDS